MHDGGDQGPARPQRTFLFLQGLASPFFKRLGRSLRKSGFRVERINLNLGDRLFWGTPGAADYRGRFGGWRGYLSKFMDDRQVTDLVLFGDGRPYHRVAIATAQLRGVAVHVFEEGYFRPDWVTLEAGGVNGFSGLPRDPDTIRRLAAALPEAPTPKPIHGDMKTRTFWDVIYNGANIAFPYLYPFYRRYRPQPVVIEYAGWVGRLLRRAAERRRAELAARALAEGNIRYFVLPLQLDSDYQIRLHSPFSAMTEVVEFVARSFAAHAPPDARLVVKLHPLDNGLVNRRRSTQITANRTRLGDRLIYIDGLHGTGLIDGAAGMVVVNSTMGTLAIDRGRPTIALGQAIYDLPGLTHQGTLESFWTDPTPPDPEFVKAYRRLVIARTQINGGFYSQHAVAVAVRNAMRRLVDVAPDREPDKGRAWAPTSAAHGGRSPVPGE